MFKRFIFFCGALLALAGCAGRPDTAAMGISEARCRAAGAEEVLGHTLDQQVLEQALLHSGALRARVLRPGMAATTDADPLRLNIEVDESDRIRRMVCG
jgi:Peptidase inhibitor I78 family